MMMRVFRPFILSIVAVASAGLLSASTSCLTPNTGTGVSGPFLGTIALGTLVNAPDAYNTPGTPIRARSGKIVDVKSVPDDRHRPSSLQPLSVGPVRPQRQ